jgi:fused signal recognition particle receptor
MANKGKFFSWFGKGKKQNEAEPEVDVEQSQADEQAAELVTEAQPEPVVEAQPKPVVEPQPEPAVEAQPEPEPELEPEPEPEVQPEAVVETQPEPEAEHEAEKPQKEGFFSRFKSEPKAEIEPEAEVESEVKSEEEKPQKEGFFARLKKGLSKTKENLGSGIVSLFRGKKIDDELFEELETQLLISDVGVETSLKLVENLTKLADRKQLKDAEALYDLLKQEMADLLVPVDQPLIVENAEGPFVILMVGVNGVGKTTTIGKMAKQFQQQGKSVMLAAGDTFRAAAVEQLTVWGERNDVPVIAQHTGADSASVIFDAIQAAKSRDVDVIIADTAGRLQNKDHLMEELKKIVRVMKKLDVNAPHEVMLTLDAGTGQNALSQVKLFSEAVGLTGLTLSKLDGTAKGGVVFAIADKFKIPIRYIGVGEGIDDLRTFNSNDFIEALFAHDEQDSEAIEQ